jgi:hypothetical protein
MPRTATLPASTVPRSLFALASALLLAGACDGSSSGTPGTAGSAGDGVTSHGGSGGSAGKPASAGAGGGGGGIAGAAGTAGSAGSTGNAGRGGGVAGAGIGGGPPATNLWSLTPAANPLTVTYTLQASARITKDVPLTGGSLKATAADGTTFELTVPGDALFAAETIVMTPVSITSQPFSNEAAWGVQLLPDGLYFNKPVTLVITPPTAAPPVNQQVPFGWSGAGNTVFLANPDPKDAHLALKLLHFSSYAYATATQGTSASLAGVRNRIGGSAEARINSAAAELLGRERQMALLGVSDENLLNSAELQKLFAEYDKEVVQVRVAAAGTSCAAGRLALQTVLGVTRQKALLGFEEGNAPFPTTLVDTVENVCVEEEWGLCRDHHIIQRFIPLVLGMERQHQLLGQEPADTSPAVTKALGYIYKCFQFQLEVSSTAGTTCDQWTFNEPVQGLVKLKLDAVPTSVIELAEPIKGMGPLTSLSYSIGYPDSCTKVSNIVQIDPRFVVQALSWSTKSDPLVSGNGEIKDFTLAGAPGLPSELNFFVWGSTHQITDLCSDPIPPPETVPEFNWYGVYTVVMGDNPWYFDEVMGWRFTDWMAYNDGGPLLAKKVVDAQTTDGDINYTAKTTLLLTHKPAP